MNNYVYAIIGDVHGRSVWREMINSAQACTPPDKKLCVIFVGDYFDSFDIPSYVQLQNFENIMQLHEQEKDFELVTLIGNHDYHYFSNTGRKYSGYQPEAAMYIKDKLKSAIDKGYLKMAHGFNVGDTMYLVSHAGISPVWFKNVMPEEVLHDIKPLLAFDENAKATVLANMVNLLFEHKSNTFEHGHGHKMSMRVDPYGDDDFQTPIWIRPLSLLHALNGSIRDNLFGEYGFDFSNIIQIVGHTGQRQIQVVPNHETQPWFICVDVQDKSNEYLFIESDGTAIAIDSALKRNL